MGSRSSKSSEKEILSQDQEEEEEPEREQYVAPRGTLPMGVGPYASLGKPRKRPETKVKKRKTPKPEATTIEELLLSDSEEEDEEEEEEGEDNKEQENSIRLNQTPVETPMTTLNDEVNEDDSADDDDSDIEFGSQFSGMNKPETGPDILFVKPDTNLPAKEIVGQGKHQYGRFPMSFSPVQSEVDLHAATIESEIRDTMEYLPSEDTTDTGLNAYFEAQMTKDQPQNKDDGESLLSDSEEEEDTSWMEDGRINKQMG